MAGTENQVGSDYAGQRWPDKVYCGMTSIALTVA